MERHEETSRAILYELPVEVITMILAELSLCDLRNVALTCKKLRLLVVDNNSLWRLKCRQMLTITHSTTHNGSSNTFRLCPYQLCRISHNWHRGFFRETVIARSTIKYMPWLSLQPNCLILSTGSTLSCFIRGQRSIPSSKQTAWRVTVPRVVRQGVRTNDISRFVVKDNFIVCGNRDGCIAVYEYRTGNHPMDKYEPNAPILKHHIKDCHEDGSAEVSAVDCSSGGDMCVVSTSSDSKVVKFWKKSSNECGHYLDDISDLYISPRRHYNTQRSSFSCVRAVGIVGGDGGKCLLMNSDETQLAIGLKGSRMPLLVDIETGRVLNDPGALRNHRECVKDITWLNDNTVTYVTHAGYLHCVDSRTGKIVYLNFDPLAASLYSVKSDGNHAIVTGCSQFSRCTLYDARAGKNYVQLLFTQKCSSPVYSVDFDAAIITAAAERGVAILNFNVNPSTTRRRDYAAIVSSFKDDNIAAPLLD